MGEYHISAKCPKCFKDIAIATIEPHATKPDTALHNFNCAVCGPVLTKIIALQPVVD